MGNGEDAEALQPPAPDPALRLLDRFVGTWEMTGRTLDSDVDNVSGRTTFEWLPGGFFLAAGGPTRAGKGPETRLTTSGGGVRQT
jgi:hypothetical protein